jgi:hypothetical protein
LLPGRGQRLFSKATRPVLEPTQPLTEWVVGALSPRVNLKKREADHSHELTTKVKKVKNYTPFPFISRLQWKHLTLSFNSTQMEEYLAYTDLSGLYSLIIRFWSTQTQEVSRLNGTWQFGNVFTQVCLPIVHTASCNHSTISHFSPTLTL